MTPQSYQLQAFVSLLIQWECIIITAEKDNRPGVIVVDTMQGYHDYERNRQKTTTMLSLTERMPWDYDRSRQWTALGVTVN